MDLLQVKHYLRARKSAPLPDIALHFRVEADTVRPLLEIWVGKGQARKQAGGGGKACFGCCRCDPAAIEVYKWTGK